MWNTSQVRDTLQVWNTSQAWDTQLLWDTLCQVVSQESPREPLKKHWQLFLTAH